MDNAYTIIPINDSQILLQQQEAILELFALCFGHKMDIELWNWAYQKNPCGNAYVYLAYKDKILVGHYAMIPQYYCNHNQQQTIALSMTTMVHPEHRRSGLFQVLADACYTQASQDGLLAVLGFPNSKSTPGFKKRLSWECNDDYQIIKIKTRQHPNVGQLHVITADEFSEYYNFHNKHFMLDLKQKDLLVWRLSKPGADYMLLKDKQQELFIVKPYTDTLDVIFASTPNIPQSLQSFAHCHGYSALASFSSDNDLQTETNLEGTQYRFGYRTFQDKNISFSPQLIMSDVF